MSSSSQNPLPDTQPDIGTDTKPDLDLPSQEDQESDPAHRAGEADGWTGEGGATPDGPATTGA